MKKTIKVFGHEIEGVTFDLEGTIVDLEKLHWKAHKKTAKLVRVEVDLDNPRTFEIIPHLIGGPDIKVITDILTLAKNTDSWQDKSESRDQMIARMVSYKNTTYRQLRDNLTEIQPREGFIELFEILRKSGIPMAIGSLTDTADARIILEKSGLNELFADRPIILREQVSRTKPDPEVYLLTAQLMDIPSSRQLVFEDSHNGIKAAVRAGSIAFGIPPMYEEPIINRLKNSGALYVAKNWYEVKKVLFPNRLPRVQRKSRR